MRVLKSSNMCLSDFCISYANEDNKCADMLYNRNIRNRGDNHGVNRIIQSDS